MSTSLADRPMTKRNDLSAKIDAEAIRLAKIVAAFRGQTLAEYLSEMVLKNATKDLDDEKAKDQSSRKPKGTK